ncbi:MAG: DUF4062 domain-containing protein [Planctomycetes bacterium]|nr:DUF4062 domain-containing protein [Planctomycetota bacterium]
MSILAGKRVFLACTDEFFDLAIHLSEKLRSNGVAPIWFHETIDSTASDNAMSACEENAAAADYLVWIIGTRFGLQHPSGISISEVEFWSARRKGKPTLLLVRDAVKTEAKSYHDNWKHLSPEDRQVQAKTAKYSTDVRVLEMIERLMHTTHDGKPAIPWIERFHDARDALQQIFHKWSIWQIQKVENRNRAVREEQPLLFPEVVSNLQEQAPLEQNSSITDIQKWLEYVYCDKSGERTPPLSRFGAALAEAGGDFMSRKRRTIGDFPTALSRYIEILLRTCTVAGLFAEREAINKFPACCAYCGLKPCKMATARPGSEHPPYDQIGMLQLARRLPAEYGPFTLDSWALEICDVYPMNWSLSLTQLIERLNEEQGEFVGALQKLERARTHRDSALLALSEEVADVLSWSVVFAQAVRRSITKAAGNEEIMNSVSQIVVDKYKVGCPRCTKFRCVRKGQCAL